MENIMKISQSYHWLLILLLFTGCAATPKMVYVSHPKKLKVSNDIFDVQIKPIKLDNPFYVGFQLTIQNKSSARLIIDWGKTHYVFNGKDQGIFVFKGIDPDSVQSGIPKETISAGETLSKPIYPIKMLGFLPKRDRSKPGYRNFIPGILPDGKNSAFLAVEQGDRRWRELLTFQFSTQQIP